RDAGDSAFGRCAGHGPARRTQCARRPAAGRGGVHRTAGLARARDRVLARRARRGDPASRARVPHGYRWRRAMAARTDQTMNGHDRAESAVVLTVDRLAKAFGGVEAVRDVSFAVSAGEIVAMIGPNGAGKTTCFNLVNGQLAPDAGSVMLLGKRIDGLPPRTIARAGVGRTFQIAATFASMTVRENVQMALIAHAGGQRGLGSRATDLYV